MKHLTKLFRATIAIAIMLCVALPTFAHDFEVNGIYYKYLDETAKTVKVTYKGSSYNSYSNEYNGAVSIPSSVIYNSTTYSVTSIGYRAFRDCTGLTSVSIPNSVTTIGDDAFYNTGWYNNQPDGVVYINNVLYKYKGTMPGGTSIDIKEGTISISDDAFYGCSGLTSITIPNSVTTIGSSAFRGCSYLTSVTIGNSVTMIGSSAFSGCSRLTSITIPNSVTTIGDYAFSGCSYLTSVTIGNSVTTIGSSAFYNCSRLTSVNITDLSAWCKIDFYGSYSNPLYYAKKLKLNDEEIKDLVIPNDITEIKDYAFAYCRSFKSVAIPNSVTTIGNSAFKNCNYCFGNLTIPNSVTTIGEDAFYGCSGLTEVNFNAENCSMSYSLFGYCSNLKTINIGNDVKTIQGAFGECSGLTSVNFNAENCTSMGSSVFSSCSNLKTINIGNNVKTIPTNAFSGCYGLTSLTIGNSVTTIGGDAFSGCSGLTSVTIPNSVTTIGSGAFSGCSGLTEVTISNSVTTIGSSAFSGCSGLTSVTIGNSVTTIGYYAFMECSGLTEVNITDLSAWCKIDFDYYNSNPLYYARKLKLNGTEIKKLVIPNDITEIKDYAFAYCYSLESVAIPNSVTTIGNSAFRNCINWFGYLTIPNSVTEIGDNAFYNCYDLISVIIGNSVTTIGSYAFEDCSGLKNIVTLNPTPPTCSGQSAFNSSHYTDVTLYVPKNSFAKYFIDSFWGQFSNIKKIETATLITLNKSSLTLDKGATETLTATITPSNTTLSLLEWTSDKPSVAVVDKKGNVTAVGDGTATISVRTLDGSNISASCKVIVGVGGVEGVISDENAIEIARYDIHGRLLSEPNYGINIIIMSDGTTRKEIVK